MKKVQALCTYLYLQHLRSMDWIQYPGSHCWLCMEWWILCKYFFLIFNLLLNLKLIEEYRLVWTVCSVSILSFIQTSYVNWQEDEPNNYNNVENCVEIKFWWYERKGEWNDVQCQDRKDWFCEIRKGKKTIKSHIHTYKKTSHQKIF